MKVYNCCPKSIALLITPERLHLAWWNFARTCTSTTSRTLFNFKVIGHMSFSGVSCAFCGGFPRKVLSLEQGLIILLKLRCSAVNVHQAITRHVRFRYQRQHPTTSLITAYLKSPINCLSRYSSDTYKHARRSLSTVGGDTRVSPQPWREINGQSSGQSTPPLLSSSHSPSSPHRNGVKSHSRCGTESWTELELAFHLTVTFLIRLQGPNDSLH